MKHIIRIGEIQQTKQNKTNKKAQTQTKKTNNERTLHYFYSFLFLLLFFFPHLFLQNKSKQSFY